MLLYVLVLWNATVRPRARSLLAAGGLLGLCVLTQLTLVCLAILLVVPLVTQLHERRDRSALGAATLALALPVVLVAPWLASNESRYGALSSLVEHLTAPYAPTGSGLGAVASGLVRFTRAALPQEWWQEYKGILGAILIALPVLLTDWHATRRAASAILAHTGHRAPPRRSVAAGARHTCRNSSACRMACVIVSAVCQSNAPALRPIRRLGVDAGQNGGEIAALARSHTKLRGERDLDLHGGRLLLHQCRRNVWNPRIAADIGASVGGPKLPAWAVRGRFPRKRTFDNPSQYRAERPPKPNSSAKSCLHRSPPAISCIQPATNRGARIRTGDLTDPNGARYQAAPRPDAGSSIPHDAAARLSSRRCQPESPTSCASSTASWSRSASRTTAPTGCRCRGPRR